MSHTDQQANQFGSIHACATDVLVVKPVRCDFASIIGTVCLPSLSVSSRACRTRKSLTLPIDHLVKAGAVLPRGGVPDPMDCLRKECWLGRPKVTNAGILRSHSSTPTLPRSATMMPSNVREQTGAMAVSLAPILTEASQTRRHLRDLCNNIASKITANALPDGVEADHRYLTDCVDRFNIWAGSLGVFQKGDASLDARLSNHILGREVLRLLKQLDTVTSDRGFPPPTDLL